jgi:transcriptional regulator with XRE-family HTH domain
MSRKKTSIDETFRIKLRELIEKRLKIKQSEFANNVGVTAGYLSMVVTGKRGPSAQLIAGIFINYSEHLAWLLNQPDNYKFNSGKKNKRPEILNELEEWISEETRKNPKKEIWFEIHLQESFPKFKDWKDKKE